MPVAVKWQMLLLSQKEALWLFNLILLFLQLFFLCINPREESFVFLGIWDGLQLHWASLLLTGGSKKAVGDLGFLVSLEECGGGTQAEGTGFVWGVL